MITKFSVAVVFAMLFGLPSFAQDAGSQKFLKEAIEGNLAEVEMGKLSQKQGASEGVRAFGQMLEKDHSDANQKATAVAKSVNIAAPTAPDKKQKADYDKMSKLSGAKFDNEFAALTWLRIIRRTSENTKRQPRNRMLSGILPKRRYLHCASTWRLRNL